MMPMGIFTGGTGWSLEWSLYLAFDQSGPLFSLALGFREATS
jgi:hypothetical protein